MKYAPIILFVYNRPELARTTLEGLMANHLAIESELFIYADGPKENATPEVLRKIDEVRKIIREKNWCGKVNIIESDKNRGLARSVIDGVTEMVKKFGKVIVVEDDVQLSTYFLNYMNDALEEYKNDDNVLSIGSWNYFCASEKNEGETFFFRFPDTKGWATYDRAWRYFEEDAGKLLSQLKEKKLLSIFDADLSYPYFTKMLEDQIAGRINSWAIRWTAVAVLQKKLTLLPSRSLSKDIGFGADATHDKYVHDYNKELIVHNEKVNVSRQPVVESLNAVECWKQFYLTNFIPVRTLFGKVREGLKSVVPDQLIDKYRKLRYGDKS